MTVRACVLAVGQGEVTPAGRNMALLPLEPVLGRLLLEAPKFRCTAEVLTMIAMLSVENVFFSPKDKREEAGRAHRRLAVSSSDHMTLVNVFNAARCARARARPATCVHAPDARLGPQPSRVRSQLVLRPLPQRALPAAVQGTLVPPHAFCLAAASAVAALPDCFALRASCIARAQRVREQLEELCTALSIPVEVRAALPPLSQTLCR